MIESWATGRDLRRWKFGHRARRRVELSRAQDPVFVSGPTEALEVGRRSLGPRHSTDISN